MLTCESLLSALISFSRSDPCHHGDRVADILPVVPGLSVSVEPPAALSFSGSLFLCSFQLLLIALVNLALSCLFLPSF